MQRRGEGRPQVLGREVVDVDGRAAGATPWPSWACPQKPRCGPPLAARTAEDGSAGMILPPGARGRFGAFIRAALQVRSRHGRIQACRFLGPRNQRRQRATRIAVASTATDPARPPAEVALASAAAAVDGQRAGRNGDLPRRARPGGTRGELATAVYGRLSRVRQNTCASAAASM